MLSGAGLSLHDFCVVSVINFKASQSLTANMLCSFEGEVKLRANEVPLISALSLSRRHTFSLSARDVCEFLMKWKEEPSALSS